jgi:UPF0755 protein
LGDFLKLIKYFFILCLVIAAVVLWQAYGYYAAPLPSQSYRIVTVSAGDSLRALAFDLEEKDIIESADIFVLWARIFGHDKKIRSGEYGIPPKTTMASLFQILRSGKSLGHRVVVPEGYNMFEVADIIEKEGLAKSSDIMLLVTNRKFIKSVLGEDQSSLEGYLFPDTYFFTKVDGPRIIVKRMVDRFLAKFASVPQREGWTRHEIVTLGSIIEKETGASSERKTISSVFHNRLEKNMKLQTDPTVMYGKALKQGQWSQNISKMDLQTDTPYNTYTRKGLPPGPISNPGVEAMTAAVDPISTSFLFFVSRNDGTHQFSESYGDHTKAVGAFQLNEKAREGKSWRDLSKRIKKAN